MGKPLYIKDKNGVLVDYEIPASSVSVDGTPLDEVLDNIDVVVSYNDLTDKPEIDTISYEGDTLIISSNGL